MSLNLVQKIDDRIAIRHVLISVSDKANLELLVSGLVKHSPDVIIYSTGGTYAAISKILGEALARKHLVAVSDYTGQPEMQGGLVKTLDFKIYLGLLAETYNSAHQDDLKRTRAVAMDLVIANLYPFSQTVARADVTPEEARTNIDIGGPCMVRASAKNYLRVGSVTDPADYAALVAELETNNGTLGLETRFTLMRKAFRHTASYDSAIAAYFAGVTEEQARTTYNTNA